MGGGQPGGEGLIPIGGSSLIKVAWGAPGCTKPLGASRATKLKTYTGYAR